MSRLKERLQAPGPKRMLALDGGGIRGAITIGFLERIESILRKQHKNPELRLSDYFDIIGGTSTGAIIAAGLSIGMEVSALKDLYLALGHQIFAQKRRFFARFGAKFKISNLEKELEKVLGDIELGGPEILTGLCLVTKRADTGSTWPLVNLPMGKYFQYNKGILLRDAVRASTAAPTYFVPEKFDVGFGEMGAFVDGGVSMHNNPSMQLFLIATLNGFNLNWATGEDQLMITSLGTGFWEKRFEVDEVVDSKLWNWASEIPSMLMRDAQEYNQLLLQYLSNSPTAAMIDSEVGNLKKDLITESPLLYYLRYNAELAREPLDKLGFTQVDPADLYEMSKGDNVNILMDIGVEAAKKQVKPNHFPEAFILSGEEPVV